MPAFLDETDEADQEDSDFESMLDNDGNETLMGGERSFSIQHNRFGRPLSSDNLLGNHANAMLLLKLRKCMATYGKAILFQCDMELFHAKLPKESRNLFKLTDLKFESNSIHPSILPSIHPSIYLSIYLSVAKLSLQLELKTI